MSTSADPTLVRLLGRAHEVTRTVAHDASAEQLYLDARNVAEARLPGPLGVAVAAVLGIAAEQRRISGMSGSLGANQAMLALALAVLERP